MMVAEPTAILVNRDIVWYCDAGTCGRYPSRQQPQVMAELARKRRSCVIVRSMRQCQVMLWIEEINVKHNFPVSSFESLVFGF